MLPAGELVNFFNGGQTRKRYFQAISQFKGVHTRQYCLLTTFPNHEVSKPGDIVISSRFLVEATLFPEEIILKKV